MIQNVALLLSNENEHRTCSSVQLILIREDKWVEPDTQFLSLQKKQHELAAASATATKKLQFAVHSIRIKKYWRRKNIQKKKT